MGAIRVAIVGVGNCASSLVQGVEYYKDADANDRVPGLMHVQFGDYHVRDIEFVAAYDVDAKKVGQDLAHAIVASDFQNGGWYPVGGSHQIVTSAVARIEDDHRCRGCVRPGRRLGGAPSRNVENDPVRTPENKVFDLPGGRVKADGDIGLAVILFQFQRLHNAIVDRRER